MLSSGGAVMDLAVDVVSAMDEVYLNNPGVCKRALIMSGIREGRAGIGTQTQLFFLLTFLHVWCPSWYIWHSPHP